MSNRFFALGPIAVALFSVLIICCTDPAKTTAQGTAAASVQSPTMPEKTDSSTATLSSVNCWVEGDQFQIAAVVDNNDFIWRQLWLRLEVVDASGKALTISGKPDIVLLPHSPAIPPRGRSSIFWAFKLSELGGTPDSIRLVAARGVEMELGAILVITQQDGVKILTPNPEGADKDPIERAWRINGVLSNPLNSGSQNPCIDVLIYGTDKRLYFAQAFDLNRDTALIKTDVHGDFLAGQTRGLSFNADYRTLPKALADKKIGFVEILGFDGRRIPEPAK